MYKSISIVSSDYGMVFFFVYDDGVVQGFVDGYVAVIGYYCEYEYFNFFKEMYGKKLSYVVCIRNFVFFQEKVCEKFGCYCGGIVQV